MLALAGDSGQVTIRNTMTRGWPAWLWPTALLTPLYLLLAAFYGIANPPGATFLTGLWAANAGLWLLAAWLGSIATIEVNPEQIAVRRHLRTQRARMDDVLRVDARKMSWRYVARYRPAPYALDVWLAGYRHWRLEYVEPEAGDRLLAALHGYGKPIWVVRTA